MPRENAEERSEPTTNGSRPRFQLDLLSWPIAARILRWPAFPLALQILTLLVLVLLALNGWGAGTDLDATALKTFRKTHLTTLTVWGLWWPAMILAVLALGRVWCTVCPMELVSRLGHLLGRRLWPGLGLPRWIRVGWLTLLAYLLMQVLVASISLHRVPHLTALMLLAMLGSAALAGLLLRHPRGFCVAACPAVPLLSVYSRISALGLDRRSDHVCAACSGRDCTQASKRQRLDGRSCPSLIRPFRRVQGDGCVLCFQCAKVCPHRNMGFGITGAGSALRSPSPLSPVETAFVMAATGFVAHEVVGEVKWLDPYFHAAPEALAGGLPMLSFRSWEGVWYLLLFPALVWGLPALVLRLFTGGSGFGTALRGVAGGAAVVVALGHGAKAVAKLSSWGGFLPLAIAEPQGVRPYQGLAEGSLAKPGVLVGLPVWGWLFLLLVGLLAWRRWPRAAGAGSTGAAAMGRVGLVAALLLYVPVLVIWALGV